MDDYKLNPINLLSPSPKKEKKTLQKISSQLNGKLEHWEFYTHHHNEPKKRTRWYFYIIALILVHSVVSTIRNDGRPNQTASSTRLPEMGQLYCYCHPSEFWLLTMWHVLFSQKYMKTFQWLSKLKSLHECK